MQIGAMRHNVVLLVVLSVARTVYGDCERPTGGDHMLLITDKVFPVSEGTMVKFTCEVGYRPIGLGEVVCSGGRWTSLNMKCEIKSCGSAGEVTNGRVEYTGTDFGSTAVVVCNRGYIPVPADNKLNCLASGWDGRLSICDPIYCEAPNQITNGYYSPEKDQYLHSEVVVYSCTGQAELNGSNTLECQEGVFSPAAPTCVLVECSNPSPTNGKIKYGSRPPYKYKASVTLRCDEGHTMNGTASVSCDINSNWSPAIPQCNPVKCKAPEIKNGEVVGGASPTYKYSDVVELKCSTGYKLDGQSRLTCGENNQWSAPVPTCALIKCETPKVDGGLLVGVSLPSYKYKDVVTFDCLEGHVMKGEKEQTCGENSQWVPKLPECTRNGVSGLTIALIVLALSVGFQWLHHQLL